PQRRVPPSQPDEEGRRVDEVLLPPLEVPVHPGDLVVLAVADVVAPTGPPELVAPGEHRDAGREQLGRHEVADRAASQTEHHGVVGVSLYSVVPAAVVLGAVPAPFAVGLVVLVVVAG